MKTTRRAMLRGTAAGLAGGLVCGWRPADLAAAERGVKIRIGSCSLDFEQAKEAGLAGVELGCGPAAERLDIARPEVRQGYKEQMKQTGLVCSSLMMSVLNSNPLASDPRAPAWLDQSIEAAEDLGAKVILVAFFGKGDLRADGKVKQDDVDVVVERLKAAAPKAQQAGVILGIENMLNARQNVAILDRIGHDSVRIYYDVGNLTGAGYDVPAEIRFLKDRIAIFHFKDNPNYLGEGKVKFGPIARAMEDIVYQGWVVLETTSPSGDRVADAKRNAAFVRNLFGI